MLFRSAIVVRDYGHEPAPVTVIANDYRYDGWLIMAGFKKFSRAVRCAVEDERGRIFIRNPAQIRSRDETTQD